MDGRTDSVLITPGRKSKARSNDTVPEMNDLSISNNANATTPSKPSSGHPRSLSSAPKFSLPGSQQTDVYAEARSQVKRYLKDNIIGVQTIAEHSNQNTKQFVTRQAESIAEFIDELVQCVKLDLGKVELENKLKRTIAAQLKRRSLTEQHSGKTDAEMFNSAMRFLKWLCPGSDSTFSTTNEKHIYPCFVELINFVAELVVRPLLDQQPTSFDEYPKQLVRSYNKTDVKPDNAEGGHRIDMALKCDTLNYNGLNNDDGYDKDSFQFSEEDLKAKDGRNDERPNYSRIFAVIEVKPNSSDANMLKGFSQLVKYSKNVYWKQHNRRFIWGLVSGGSNVKACVLGPNFLLASRFMDVTTVEGRLELIGFLVNWSFCELPKLGYDPTIRFNHKHGCFTIDMADREPGAAQTTYYLRKIVVVAERVFGRHTRCFVVGKQPPSSDENCNASADILIKDAWPEVSGSAEDDMRDESKLLERVSNGLTGRSEYEGLYPKYINGGRMQIQNAHGEGVEDTTRTVLGETVWAQLGELPLRAHMRIAMSGVGEPLKFIKSIPELIVAIYDVMRCHMGILKHCQILHRDISEANILVRRDGTGVHGMLIDFDHAISITDDGYAKHAERTGTLPFMSVSNLEDKPTKRTALDDWESIIYILCWLGTFGWNSAIRQSDSKRRKNIASWDGDDVEDIAEAKRNHMHSRDNFTGITKGFNPNISDIGRLAKVVKGLRAVLIDNHNDPDLRGAMIISDSFPEENDSDEETDQYDIWAVKSARKPTDIFFRNKYIHRSVMREVVAAVPGMVGGLIRHIKSLQGMHHDGGWIGHLLHEAENERMHLMTWMEVSKPVMWERALIATVQTGFFAVFSLLYMVSPRTAHRVVEYLEEEAVTLYTHFISEIDAGRIENVKAPEIAVAYWNLDPESTLCDVVLAVRADEALHCDTNHHFSDCIRAKRESLFEDMDTNSNKPHIKY
ncbi:inducible alternative oxidase 2 [Coemansia sp. RSA 720]|nr:inducible alternative oxidase 2 [Coemansia sp. RSA 720]